MSEAVPFNDLSRIHAPLRESFVEAFTSILDSNQFILGPGVSAFEEALAQACESEFAIGVSSGTDALLASLMALNIGPGDEVITTPYTFFATAGTIMRLGATPVFVDIEPDSFNLNVKLVQSRLSHKTKAIMPVHLFGQCADMKAILSLAKEANIPVVEDAAQSIGATDSEGRTAGAMGAMGCFSFFPAKNLGGFGDGGAITTNDEVLATQLRSLRVHGSPKKYMHERVGGNFRLDALQAAILQIKLPHLSQWTQQRQNIAQTYRTLFEQSGLTSVLRLPTEGQGNHVYNQFVIRAPKRDALREHLMEYHVASAVYYPLALHQQPCFQHLELPEGSFPEAEKATNEVLALPVFPGMREDEAQRVVQVISRFYQ
jgi:dTDP-4-amino-4,6-dideoxygalactose transaminase